MYEWADPPSWSEKPMVEEQLLSRAEATDKARQGSVLVIQWRSQGDGDKKKEQRDLVRSQDFFATQQIVLDDVDEFVVVGGRAFANRRGALWITPLTHFSFTEARLPAALSKGSVFGLLVSEHHFLLGVPTQAGETVIPGHTGRLFRSDASGETWTLAVDKCHHVLTNKTKGRAYWRPDVHLIQGVEGAILANKVVGVSEQDPKVKEIRTFSTHDNGIHWSAVSDSKCDIGEVCRLQLGLVGWNDGDIKDDWSDATSMVTAPGVVMAMGGRPADADTPGTINGLLWGLYHSRDAGATWTLAAEGPQHWAVGDHGAVALRVRASKMTHHAFFSWTEGWTDLFSKSHPPALDTWEERTFEPVQTDRIVLGHSAYVPQTSSASSMTPQTHMLILGHNPQT